jgi:hypothetical protein
MELRVLVYCQNTANKMQSFYGLFIYVKLSTSLRLFSSSTSAARNFTHSARQLSHRYYRLLLAFVGPFQASRRWQSASLSIATCKHIFTKERIFHIFHSVDAI